MVLEKFKLVIERAVLFSELSFSAIRQTRPSDFSNQITAMVNDLVSEPGSQINGALLYNELELSKLLLSRGLQALGL